jgi:hypothetical protein
MSRGQKQVKEPATGIAAVAFMITRKQKQQLADLGYSEEAIRTMTPEQAHEILASVNGASAPAKQSPPPTDTAPADTNIDPEVKSNLDRAWVKIENARKQEAEGRKLWIEGPLELINILDDARKRLGSIRHSERG